MRASRVRYSTAALCATALAFLLQPVPPAHAQSTSVLLAQTEETPPVAGPAEDAPTEAVPPESAPSEPAPPPQDPAPESAPPVPVEPPTPTPEDALQQALADIAALRAELDVLAQTLADKERDYNLLDREVSRLRQRLAEESEARIVLERKLAIAEENGDLIRPAAEAADPRNHDAEAAMEPTGDPGPAPEPAPEVSPEPAPAAPAISAEPTAAAPQQTEAAQEPPAATPMEAPQVDPPAQPTPEPEPDPMPAPAPEPAPPAPPSEPAAAPVEPPAPAEPSAPAEPQSSPPPMEAPTEPPPPPPADTPPAHKPEGKTFTGTGEFVLSPRDRWVGDGETDVFEVLAVDPGSDAELDRAEVIVFGEHGVVEQGAQFTRMMKSGLYTIIVLRVNGKTEVVELLVEREG